ncbi:MAG: hypothetical protein HKN82_01660 [Akkermansiaceae bacterium]|nr:hypothetical protein [Akkermansiaceae bacterium]NNM28582.1 hypothetical protein [Akkermansiaceae bacterium]
MGLFLTACDVDQTAEGELPKVDVSGDPGALPKVEITESGRLPSVDVDVKGGKLPAYDVDGPDVDVGTKEVTIKVPTVDVDLPNDGPEGGGDESKQDLEN